LALGFSDVCFLEVKEHRLNILEMRPSAIRREMSVNDPGREIALAVSVRGSAHVLVDAGSTALPSGHHGMKQAAYDPHPTTQTERSESSETA
jgi:hypothetical protein